MLWLLAQAWASGVLLDGEQAAPLDALGLEVTVDGRVAHGTATYTFGTVSEGALFAAGLPEGAAVTGLRVRLDDSWIDATASAEVHLPEPRSELDALLPGDLFDAILPSGSATPVQVELSWQALLAAADGKLALSIPLGDGGLNPSDPVVQWTVAVEGHGPLDTFVAVPGTASIDEGIGQGAGAAPLSTLDRLEISWTEPPPLFGIDVVTYRPQIDPFTGEGEPDGYALVTLLPGPEDPSARVDALYTFAIDGSASMQGRPMDTAVAAAARWLRDLAPTDRFNLVPYTSVAVPFRGRAPLATRGAVDRAIAFLERQKPAGLSDPTDGLVTSLVLADDTVNQRSFFSCAGTARADDGPPTRHAEVVPTDGPPVIAAPYVVWITDGGATTGQTDLQAIVDEVSSANTVGASIFAVGVGNEVDLELLGRVTGSNRGEVRYAERVADVPSVVAALEDRIANPVLVRPTARVPGATDQAPAALPDVALGTEVVLAFRFSDVGPTRLKLTGLRGQRITTERFDLQLPSVDEAHPAVARVWAQLRVADLDRRYLDGDTSVVDELQELVRAYGVASKVVTLDFGADPSNRADGDVAAYAASSAGGCSCATPRGLAGGIPLCLVALLALRRRRLRTAR